MGITAAYGSGHSSIADLLQQNIDGLEDALRRLQEAVCADCTGVSWFEPGEDRVRILPFGLPELTRFETTPAMPGRTICSYPLDTGRPLAVTRFVDDAPEGYTKCNFMVAEGMTSYLAHPLPRLGPDFRMLAVALTRVERDWSECDVEHARRAALAIAFVLGPVRDVPGRGAH